MSNRPERYRVFESVRTRIIGLEFAPGAAISENDLATTLGVSRTPVREALLLLAEDGLVEVFPKVGTFVSRVDPARVAEAQFLRESVELASLRSLPTALDEQIVADLRHNLKEQAKVAGDLQGFFALDEAFHRGLMALAGHETSWSTVAAAKGHLDRARMLGITQTPELNRVVDEHRSILDKVVEGERRAAEDQLRHHLRAVFEDIKVVAEEQPELFVRDPQAVPTRRAAFIWQ